MSTSDTRPALYSDEPVRRYNRVAMAFHWLVAALLLINVVYGLKATSADDAHVRPLIDMHKSIGLTILGLVLLRIFWRLGHTPPPFPRRYGAFDRMAAHAAHLCLYAIMLLLPLSGYLHDSAWNAGASHPLVLFGLLHFPRMPILKALDPATKDKLHTIFGVMHTYFGYALYALFALHLLGVAKHHAVDHESEMARMLPAGYTPPDGSEAA